MQLESGSACQSEPVSITQPDRYAQLKGAIAHKSAIRAVEIDKVTILVPLMYLTVKAGYLPVRITDKHLVFPAAIHGDTTDVRDLLIQEIAFAFIDTVKRDEIGDPRFTTASPEENGRP